MKTKTPIIMAELFIISACQKVPLFDIKETKSITASTSDMTIEEAKASIKNLNSDGVQSLKK
ncbi:hypothetical protein EZ449_12260 [Pedobacter frigidisoli]|uniref:Uncharacterized protein n=1 Tax=Pedobacter frigidisoli TaxID=2530455 RepID=A0A4V2MMU1_9SPHI|nr:hypothetical protein [Pedobacter frigidisoli]TCD08606.1 hypothetical protein EZ449_12260 [Pedobacter frigidisoli]